MKKIISIAIVFFTVVFVAPVFAVSNIINSDNNSGWVNVPLMDTKSYDINCEYRFWLWERKGSKKIAPPKKNVFYAGDVLPCELFIYTVEDDSKMEPYRISCTRKGELLRKYKVDSSRTIAKLEKKCKLPDTAPSGMIGQFALAQCPDGWSTWLFAKATVECNTSNCKIAVCKKD